MKGGVKGIIILIFILIATNFVLAEQDKSLSPIDAAVTIIDTKPPKITILSPLNITYNNATPILINYTIFDLTLNSTWYSLNSQPNISITSPFLLSLAEGDYHLVIYANDSTNLLNSSEVNFNMNASASPFCGDTICNGGEDCSSCSTDCGVCQPSGGNGGGGSIKISNFTISKEEIKITLKKRETKTESFIILNTGRNTLNIKIGTTSSLEGLISIEENDFSLNPGEEKTIIIKIITTDSTISDLYTGNIIINGNNLKKEIFVTLEITTLKALFDVSVTILDQFLTSFSGEDVLAEVEIIDISRVGIVDVEIITTIKNSEGNIITEKKDTRAVDKQLNFIEKIEIPSDTPPGKYIFYIKIIYNGQVAIGSDTFNIELKKDQKNNIYIILIILIILGIIYTRKGKWNSKKIAKTINDYLKHSKFIKCHTI